MRRTRYFNGVLVLFITLAFTVWTLLSTSVPALRGKAHAALAESDAKTIVAFHMFGPPNGQIILDASPNTFIDSFGMATMARHFSIGGESYALMINGNTGRLKIHKLAMMGQDLGQITFSIENPLLRCTGAGVAPDGDRLYLFLHNSFLGTILRLPILEGGAVSLNSPVGALDPGWRDKNLFSVFKQGVEWRLFALDTWTGKVMVGDFAGQKISEDTWTSGYTSVDHFYVDKTTTYRLIYKAAGDPYKSPGESGDSAGLFVIQKLSADGLNAGNTQATIIPPVLSPDKGESGWSNLRFITMNDAPTNQKHSVFFYNRETGDYKMIGFDPAVGVLTPPTAAQGNIGPRWTDIDPFSFGIQTRLITLNYEDVKPFYYDEVERMALEIHKRLATKVVGYQFIVSQSGRVIYSRGWGKKRLDLNNNALEQMTTRTKHDLGSVSKMITAVTALKLSTAAGVPGLESIQLNGAIANYLDADDYPSDSWVKQMTVKNLLTHTTGMKVGGCESNPDDLKMDCGNFFAAQQSDSLFNKPTGDYKWNYNNSNIGAARKVIEYATGTTTSEEIVNKTYDLWARDADFNPTELSCQHDPEVYYFAPCHGAENCYDYKDQTWQQSHLIEDWSSTCSAGGWAASSRHMLEFLHAIRYKRILGETSEQKLLTDTEMTSGGAPTALSWEPPWSFGSAKYLGKNGANGDDDTDAAFHTYITRLPDNADAVLLVNTAGVDPAGILISAYAFSVDPASYPLPFFISEDTFKTEETVSKVALNETPTNSIYASPDYVTASRNEDNKLLLTLWDSNIPGNGQIERVEDLVDISIRDVEITDGLEFVTAVRDADGRLRVITWNKSFGLSRNGEAVGDEVGEISVTKACSNGAQGRAVTASRNKDGKLQVDLWEYDNSTNEVTLTDTRTLGAATGITIETLKYVNSLDQDARVVTAMRNSLGRLQVDVWDILSSGQLFHKDGDSFSLVTGAASTKKIAIDPRGAGGDFFDGVGFLTASINSDGKLQIITWKTDAFGNITRVDDYESWQTVTSLDVTRATTAVRYSAPGSSKGSLLLTRWSVTDLGDVSPRPGDTWGGAINQVEAAGNLLTACRNDKDKLVLINWWPTQ